MGHGTGRAQGALITSPAHPTGGDGAQSEMQSGGREMIGQGAVALWWTGKEELHWLGLGQAS